MANKKSAFAGIFQEKAPELIEEPTAPVPPAPLKPIVRASGKRSNPDFRQWCGLLKIDTVEAVEDILTIRNRKTKRDGGLKLDVSDVVQELLEDWIARNREQA